MIKMFAVEFELLGKRKAYGFDLVEDKNSIYVLRHDKNGNFRPFEISKSQVISIIKINELGEEDVTEIKQ